MKTRTFFLITLLCAALAGLPSIHANTIIRPTPTPRPRPTLNLGIGLAYMVPSLHAGDSEPDLATLPCWTNPEVPVVLVRAEWAWLEPVQGQINWHYFDSALQLAHDHRKKVALVVTAGVTSPSWIFNPPTNAEQLTVHDAEGNAMVIPVPWDANFQSVWGNLVQALGARYGSDPAFIYADISGLGREHETVFVSEEDVAPCNAKAQTDGFPSCMAAWTAGAEWGIDLFHAAFPSKSFFFVGAVPSPEQDGIGALYAVVRWGAAKYANFGFKNCGLWPGNAWPPANSPGTLLVQELSASRRPTMYQFHLPIDTYAEMNESLTKGMNNGAIGIEVFATNGDNSIFLPLFDVANTRMLSR